MSTVLTLPNAPSIDHLRDASTNVCRTGDRPPRRPAAPPSSPDARDVRAARLRAGLTTREAADIVSRNERSWRGYEAGSRVMPGALWGWFQWRVHGWVEGHGDEWSGYQFSDGELHTPLGRSLLPQQVEQLQMAYHLAELQAQEVNRLRGEVKELRQRLDAGPQGVNERSELHGGMRYVQHALAALWADCNDSDDIGLQRLCDEFQSMHARLQSVKTQVARQAAAD